MDPTFFFCLIGSKKQKKKQEVPNFLKDNELSFSRRPSLPFKRKLINTKLLANNILQDDHFKVVKIIKKFEK